MYNNEIRIVEESIHVKFDDKLDLDKSKIVEKFLDLEISYSDSKGNESKVKDFEDSQHKVSQSESKVVSPVPLRNQKQRYSHPKELILGDKAEPIRTRSSFKPSDEMILGLVYLIELNSICEALLDAD